MSLATHKHNHIEAWQASGLSQVAYCREHKLNAKTFTNWLRIYRIEQIGLKPPAMIPVSIKPAFSSTDSLRLCCSGEHVLELPANVSPQDRKSTRLNSSH